MPSTGHSYMIWSRRNILLTIDEGIEPVFPYTRPMTKEGFFRKHEYVYDEHYDCYICPEDHVLNYSTTNREGYREYKSCPACCESCPSLEKCTLSRNHVKVVTRHVWEDPLPKREGIPRIPLLIFEIPTLGFIYRTGLDIKLQTRFVFSLTAPHYGEPVLSLRCIYYFFPCSTAFTASSEACFNAKVSKTGSSGDLSSMELILDICPFIYHQLFFFVTVMDNHRHRDAASVAGRWWNGRQATKHRKQTVFN